MSSRALRKLQNDDDLLESLINATATKISLNNKNSKRKNKKETNLFSYINEVNSSPECGDDSVSHEGKYESDNNSDQSEQKNIVLQTKSQKKNRKNRNKKKKKDLKKATTEDNKTKLDNRSDNDDEDEDDDEFDQIIQQFQKKNVLEYGSMTNDFKFDSDEEEIKNIDNSHIESDNFLTASDNENDPNRTTTKVNNMADIYFDPGFSKFPMNILKNYSWAFNTNFKKLDPHTEFKLLFDDISAESLDDIDSLSSTHISPQQLKQIQRMKRLVRNWGGHDNKTVPNGPGGLTHRLQFTKVRPDWLPSQRGELVMSLLSQEEVTDWQLWQRPNEWKDMINEDVVSWRKDISYFKFEALNTETNKKALTEFYFSVILHPDHEALISLISSKYPYHVPGLLQVALIMLRQGDKSNANSLIQKSLFVFDRALKTSLYFNPVSMQLPFIYFYNRQFYFAIFRNIQMLAQRGAVATAGEWTKALWSLSPLEDPVGCRYFIDHYLLQNNEYHYIIKISNSPLVRTYKEWYTLGLAMAVVLSYLKIDEQAKALKELKRAFKYHSKSLAYILKEKLLSDIKLSKSFDIEKDSPILIETKAYIARFSLVWKDSKDLSFLLNQLKSLFEEYDNDSIEIAPETDYSYVQGTKHSFYINKIPINLLRFAFLSDESSVVASIPQYIWSQNQIYEFDILPPEPVDRETIDIVENITSFINEHDLGASELSLMQDESLLNQVRQMSLDQFLQENPNAGIDE